MIINKFITVVKTVKLYSIWMYILKIINDTKIYNKLINARYKYKMSTVFLFFM